MGTNNTEQLYVIARIGAFKTTFYKVIHIVRKAGAAGITRGEIG